MAAGLTLYRSNRDAWRRRARSIVPPTRDTNRESRPRAPSSPVPLVRGRFRGGLWLRSWLRRRRLRSRLRRGLRRRLRRRLNGVLRIGSWLRFFFWFFLDGNQFDFKDQRGVGANVRASLTIAVGEIARNVEFPL